MNYFINLKYTLFVSICLLYVVSSRDSVNNDVVNAIVKRKIDISTQLVRITSTITIENTGKSPIASYLFTVDNELESQLSYIKATVNIYLSYFMHYQNKYHIMYTNYFRNKSKIIFLKCICSIVMF